MNQWTTKLNKRKKERSNLHATKSKSVKSESNSLLSCALLTSGTVKLCYNDRAKSTDREQTDHEPTVS